MNHQPHGLGQEWSIQNMVHVTNCQARINAFHEGTEERHLEINYIYIYLIKSGCCCFSKRKFQLFILKLDQKGRACPAWPHFAFQMRMVLFQLTSKGHPWPQCHSSYFSDPGCKGTNFIQLHGWRALIGGMMKPDGINGKLRVCRKQCT